MTLNIQMIKSMKQFAAITLTGLKALVLAAACLWLVNIITAPIGGIVIFSAIFTVGLAGFGSAVLVFHLLAKLSR
ncbi:MAG: hypothetical protein WC748_00185 [Legionellales bacterium]|jgi:hypothetical protein